MYSYIARQPILNIAQETIVFELLFRNGKSNSFPNIHPNKATSKIIVDNHLALGMRKLPEMRLPILIFMKMYILVKCCLMPVNH